MNENNTNVFAVIKAEIDKATDDEVLTLSKISSNNIDTEAIREKKEAEVFDGIRHQMENLVAQFIPFIGQLKEDNEELYDKLKKNSLDKATFTKKMEACKSAEDFKNVYKNPFSNEEMSLLNEIGRNWFKEGLFDKAYLYFLYLSIADPANVEYLLSKGMAQQNLAHYDEALQSYFYAMSLDPTRFLIYLQIIDCLILNKKIEEAKRFYSILEEEVKAEDFANNPFYIAKMETIKEFLLKAA